MDCDDDANKQFCGSMGVKGFPTLKIVRPRKGGKPMVEDYNGPRTATGIVEAVVERINNHVKKVTDKDLDKFLSEKNETAKAILFTEKGTTTALLKSIAIDFLDVITIGQIRNKETKAVETFGIEKFPTLVLLPGGDKDAIIYDGELKKPAMIEFLSQAGSPNPDPAPVAAKSKNAKSKKSSAPKSSETATSEASSATSEAAETQQAPVIVDSVTPIPAITTSEKLVKECLSEKSSTCVLALVPSTHGENAKEVLSSLSTLAHRYAQGSHRIFPMYEVARENEAAASLIKSLELSGEVDIVAINARRGWWRHYQGTDFSHPSIASWIDAIRMSEGAKNKLPDGIIGMAVEGAAAEPEAEASPESTASETTESSASEEPEAITPDPSESSAEAETASTQATEPTPESETAAEEEVKHEEL